MTMTEAPSPNFNDRKRPLRYIILHYTGMKDGPSALARMCDPEAQVSAHYMVEEDGRVFRLVADEKRAWHAGVSRWHDETDLNSASIGIEIVNGGHEFGLPDFPDQQIEGVITLVRRLLEQHGLDPRDVIGHADIAPARKEDPGERFPWSRLEAAGCAIGPAAADGADASSTVQEDLAAIGYDPDAGLEAVVRAFQRRYRPACVDGKLDAETQSLVGRVRKAITAKF